jgi:trehalose 2-sulfotransferase
MAKYDSYVICTSPRSGSTLLCTLLTATGVAGKPASYFYDQSVEDWLAELGIAVDEAATDREVLETALTVVLRVGTNGTGLFGLRQQAHSLAFLCEKLALLAPEETTDAGRFQKIFGATFFVYLSRADKVDQAVSYLKAKQSGLWHVAHDGSELERNAPHRDPTYDSEELRACVRMMQGYDSNWNEWFAREGIEPLRISYDSLAASPIETLREVLASLGIDRSAADGVVPGVRKLADSINRAWSTRFRAEQGVAKDHDSSVR